MKYQHTKKTSPKLKKRYPAWFYVILMMLPSLIILILELTLRATDYGKNYDTFIKVSDNLEQYLFFNPEVVGKFFSDKSVVPSVIPDAFREIKDPETFRIFILGGSSAAGYPYPTNASFGRQLKRRLQLVYPGKDFEVVNLGVSAVNSVFIAHIIDDVLKQSPDLILIYAGHNEYYGAFGAAFNSMIKLPPQFILGLKELKVYQLIESGLEFLIPQNANSSRTLMAEMAGDNLVPLDSQEYRTGLNTFTDNLNYVLSRCSTSAVPVILGSVTSNLMQRPLDKIINPESDAVKKYKQGIAAIDTNLPVGKELLVKAKDEDMLRFRASEDINAIIISEASKNSLPLVQIDSVFRMSITGKPDGYELFADHLHPNINGYFQMSKLFFEKIEMNKFININPNKSALNIADKILRNTFPFTSLDSTFADIKLKILLDSYPFTKEGNTNIVNSRYPLRTRADSLAMAVINGVISWDNAHYKLAEHYYGRKNYKGFFNEMMALIYDKPYDTYRYNAAAKYLTEAGRSDLAFTVVSLLYKTDPGIPTLKELGRLSYEMGNYRRAVYFFESVLKSAKNDPNTFLLAAKSYIKLGNVETAKKLLNYAYNRNPESREINRLLDSLSVQ